MHLALTGYYEKYWPAAFGVSCFGHLLLFYFILTIGSAGLQKLPKNIVYSVSLESSDKLGGISQVPKTKGKTPIAPPKNVSKSEKAAEKSVKTVSPEKAEVSIAEKKKPEKKKEPPKEKKLVAVKKEPAKKDVKKSAKKTPAKKTSTKKKGSSYADINRNYQAAMQRYLGESTDAGGRGFGGDGRGGRGMGGGVLRSPEWFLYKDKLESFIKRGWKWHTLSSNLYAVVQFQISPAGVISKIELALSSGNRKFDDSILRAVSKASPVPPAPPHLYNDFSYIEMDFRPE